MAIVREPAMISLRRVRKRQKTMFYVTATVESDHVQSARILQLVSLVKPLCERSSGPSGDVAEPQEHFGGGGLTPLAALEKQ